MPVMEDLERISTLHRLTHRKLSLAEERERRVAEHFVETFGEQAMETLEAVREAHPPFLGSARLEELLEEHGATSFLEEAARAQALREAATLTALQQRFGDEAEVELRLCSYDHGWETGERVARLLNLEGCTPSMAADLLADHYPGGTAWGPGPRITRENGTEARWRYLDASVLEIWKEAGASAHLLCSAAAFWCKGFGEGLNPRLDFRMGGSLADGDPCSEALYTLEPGTGTGRRESEPDAA